MAVTRTPGAQNATKYPFTGSNYAQWGEQPGYIYYPWTDSYYVDPSAQQQYAEDQGYAKPKPKEPASTGETIAIGAGAVGAGALAAEMGSRLVSNKGEGGWISQGYDYMFPETPTNPNVAPNMTGGEGMRAPQVSAEPSVWGTSDPGLSGNQGAQIAGGEMGGGHPTGATQQQAPPVGGFNAAVAGAGVAGGVAGGYIGQEGGEAAGLSPNQARGTSALGAGVGGGAAAGAAAGTGAGAGALAGGAAAIPIAVAMFAGGSLSDSRERNLRPFLAHEVMQDEEDLLDLERLVPGYLTLPPDQQLAIAQSAQANNIFQARGEGDRGKESTNQEGLDIRNEIFKEFGNALAVPTDDPAALMQARAGMYRGNSSMDRKYADRAQYEARVAGSNAGVANYFMEKQGIDGFVENLRKFQGDVFNTAGEGLVALAPDINRGRATQEAYGDLLAATIERNQAYLAQQLGIGFEEGMTEAERQKAITDAIKNMQAPSDAAPAASQPQAEPAPNQEKMMASNLENKPLILTSEMLNQLGIKPPSQSAQAEPAPFQQQNMTPNGVSNSMIQLTQEQAAEMGIVLPEGGTPPVIQQAAPIAQGSGQPPVIQNMPAMTPELQRIIEQYAKG